MATEIKYKDTTITVEAGQTVTLNTTDKKLTGDIEVITPADSGGGVKKYKISYDFSSVTPDEIIAQPTEICEGQTAHFVYGSNVGGLDENTTTTNCNHAFTDYATYKDGVSWVQVLELSDATGDVTVKLIQSHSGGSA